jgi:ABC-type sugar transport system, periplasmic component
MVCIFFVYQGNADKINKYPVTRVTVILPHNDEGYWSLVAEGINEEQDAIGAEYNIDISTMIPQLNYNIPQMTDILKQQIAAQVDVIVIQGNDDPEFRKALLEAYAQGIKIICVDTDLSNFPDHLYVGTDNYKAGETMGEKLIELTNGTAKVAVVSGKSGYLNLEQRWNGFMDAVKSYPGIEVVDFQYDNYDGLTFMNLYQKLHEKADTLVCIEGTGAATLSEVYDKPRLEYKHILGFDINTGVKNQVIDGVVRQDTNQMGRRVVDEIVNYIKTGKYSSDNIYTDIQWLTIDNYDEVIK